MIGVMHRFFLTPKDIQDQIVLFPSDTAHQILRVLRLHAGEQVVVLDNRGNEFLTELECVDKQSVSGRVLEQRLAASEPATALTLYLCLTQREKFEWMLQKCTEVGAAAFVPVLSSRSLVQSETDAANKLERWQKIIQEAAEQSHRGRIPQLMPPVRFAAAVQEAANHADLCLFAWEETHSQGIRKVLANQTSGAKLAALIGPEGGLSELEAQQAAEAGWQMVSLGPRILRMETAAVVMTSLVLGYLGELD